MAGCPRASSRACGCRISDGIHPDIEAKIQLIRGDNDAKDAKLQLIHVTINGD